MTESASPKQYAERDTEALGEHYMRHLDAMTRENLYSKSAIAAELAWRDSRIAELEAKLATKEQPNGLRPDSTGVNQNG